MALIYLAHQYFAETKALMEANRQNAIEWALWIVRTFGVSVSANWIWWCERLAETPENRELGLSCDDQEIVKCDEFWMVGGRISSGMARGRYVAIDAGVRVRDLTAWGSAFALVPPRAVSDLRVMLVEKGLIR
jgi:hypothetical protein